MTTHTCDTARLQRRYCLVSLLLSFFVPGLGLMASGKLRRGLVWFVLCYIVLNTILSCSSLYSVHMLIVFIGITCICYMAMLADSWCPIIHPSLTRCICLICSAVVIGVVLIVYDPWSYFITFDAVSVSSMSMQPTLITDDRVGWLRSAYRKELPQRGDIVIVATNGLPINGIHARRVAGLPCETIGINPPLLIVNGCVVSDPPIFRVISESTNGYTGFMTPSSHRNNSSNMSFSPCEVKLGSNEYFLLGDNSRHALDSRYYGPVHRTNIIGKVNCIFWPPNRIRDL